MLYGELRVWASDLGVYQVKKNGDWVDIQFWVRNESYLDVFWDLNDRVIETFPDNIVDGFVLKETPSELCVVVRINAFELGDDIQLGLDVANKVDECIGSHLTY